MRRATGGSAKQRRQEKRKKGKADARDEAELGTTSGGTSYADEVRLRSHTMMALDLAVANHDLRVERLNNLSLDALKLADNTPRGQEWAARAGKSRDEEHPNEAELSSGVSRARWTQQEHRAGRPLPASKGGSARGLQAEDAPQCAAAPDAAEESREPSGEGSGEEKVEGRRGRVQKVASESGWERERREREKERGRGRERK